jgi:hypothetical protein
MVFGTLRQFMAQTCDDVRAPLRLVCEAGGVLVS